MRKNFFLLLAFTVLGFAAQAQKNDKNKYNDKERIEGSGNVITKDVAVKSFNELTANGVFNL